MASLGNYQIPKEFKDEDKWFRFFTKFQLALFAIAVGLSILVLLITSVIHLLPIGVIITEILVGAALIFGFINLPSDRYMIGGGYPVRTIVMRIITKNLKRNKKIYVKNYDEARQKPGISED